MTVPAGRAPLAAQALQRLGYHLRESWVQQEMDEKHAPNTKKLQIKKITPTAQLPTQDMPESIGYDLYLDLPEIVIPPGEIGLLPTGISARPPNGSYIRIAPRSGLTVKHHLHTMAGVIDPDYTGNITVVLHNFGNEEYTLQRGNEIAQMVIENASTPILIEVDNLAPTTRGSEGFGSTDNSEGVNKISYSPASLPPTRDPEIPRPKEPPEQVIPIVSAVEKEAITKDIHLTFSPPYSIGFLSSPLDNQTF